MAGTSFYMFWFRSIPKMVSSLSAAFLYDRTSFAFSARLVVHYFAVYSVLGSFSNFNGSGNEYNGCVSVRYNSLFISLPRALFAKVHKTTT